MQTQREDVKTLSFVEVKAPETHAFITIRKAGGQAKAEATPDLSMRKSGGDTQSIIGVLRQEDIDGVFQAHATFVLTVLARQDGKPLCVVTRFISTEPRPTPTPQPTSTLVPTNVPSSGGNTSSSSSRPKPTAVKVCTSIGPCR
jgi:hypothetical protein